MELLRLTLAGYDGPVIVPMTLVDSGYFREVIGSLREDGFAVRHFALLAEPATVRRRLGRRSLGTEARRGSWAVEHLDEHLQRLGAPEFAEHIHTDRLTVARWLMPSPARRAWRSGRPLTARCEPGCAGMRRPSVMSGSTDPAAADLFTPSVIADIAAQESMAPLFEVDSNYGRWHAYTNTQSLISWMSRRSARGWQRTSWPAPGPARGAAPARRSSNGPGWSSQY